MSTPAVIKGRRKKTPGEREGPSFSSKAAPCLKKPWGLAWRFSSRSRASVRARARCLQRPLPQQLLSAQLGAQLVPLHQRLARRERTLSGRARRLPFETLADPKCMQANQTAPHKHAITLLSEQCVGARDSSSPVRCQRLGGPHGPPNSHSQKLKNGCAD